jgi:hypothetical protein
MVLVTLGKAADDIGGNGDIGDVFEEIVADSFELFHCVLSVHFREHGIVTGLDGDMNEAEDARMIEEAGDGFQMVEHVWRVSHA